MTRRRPVARRGPEGPLLTFAEAVELAGYRRARLFAGRRFAVFFAAALRRRRFAGAFFAVALRRRRLTGLAAAALRRRFAGFRAVDLRVVRRRVVVRRFAGFRAVFLADFRAVRLFAGGTVTTFRRE